jgi:hypothetical protein
MNRLGAVALFLIILAIGFGAAWLGGLSRKRWMPTAAFWTTVMTLGGIAQFWLGIELGGE